MVAACAPKVTAPVVAAVEEPAPPAALPARVAVVGPADWAGAGGLCLAVPSGWEGTEGPPPEVLVLDDASGTVRFAVHLLQSGAAPAVDREGFVLAFEDLGSYRTVSLLSSASLRTWQPIDPAGPTLMAWWGDVASRTIAVEVRVAHGHATEGLDLVQPLLEGLCVR